MCGIAGLINLKNGWSAENFGNITFHRGPDNLGVYESDDVILTHNRLSIIDLSSIANQPMVSADGGFVMVYNGEIYNYKTLKSELEQQGAIFKTNSDTEVLLAGYERWGKGVLDKLDGMFAFAIWDLGKKQLFCARDHVGIKPFLFWHNGQSLAFSSELKTLESVIPDLTIDKGAVAEYLIYNYVPAPKTIYSNVKKLLPGHYFEFDLNSGKLEMSMWWQIPDTAEKLDVSYQDAVKLVREKVGQSVRSQLIADVPVSAFLSGGVDSSIIVAEMAQTTSNAKVFSIGYKDNDEYDETQYAKIVAERFGLSHHVIYPDFSSDSILSTVDLILDQMDEPYGNPTVSMTNIICQAAKKEAVVALVGDGGDEVFGGYPRYRALEVAKNFQPLLSVGAPAIGAILSLMPETPWKNHFIRRSKQFVKSQGKPPAKRFQGWTSVITYQRLKQISSSLGHSFLESCRDQYLADFFDECHSGGVDAACYTDQKSFLPYNLLDGADRLSMQTAFELRVPFVNRELLELSAKLKPEWKIKGKVTKRILKDAYTDLLPDEIINRPKRGFNPPVWNWLQSNQEFVREYLNNKSRVAVLFENNYIESLTESFYRKQEDSSSHLWALLVLERWIEKRNVCLR